MVSTEDIGYKAFTGTERKASLKERFQNYVTENSALIVSGLMVLSGSGNAYTIYHIQDAEQIERYGRMEELNNGKGS